MSDESERTLGGRADADDAIDISATALLDTLPQPAFIVDGNHRVDEAADIVDEAATDD